MRSTGIASWLARYRFPMPGEPRSRYLIALGGNQPHPRYGSPERVLEAAIMALSRTSSQLIGQSRIMPSAPIGPSIRTYANAAVILETDMLPPALLCELKALEATFGRRNGGQRWRARPLDLDIILWSEGCWNDRSLTIPHPLFRERRFVLVPAVEVAAGWRDPISRLSNRHLLTRLDRKRPPA
jgi:2-amino-4-hydroxy-6-hydroxymethyldihydropteridine diphosphokinase